MTIQELISRYYGLLFALEATRKPERKNELQAELNHIEAQIEALQFPVKASQ
jgi:hypothetical protein